MKILLSAYACEPGRGSEGEIGWRLVLNLASRHELWVITRANLRPVHDAAFRETPRPPSLHFVYFDLPWILRFYKRGNRFFLIYYYLWQFGVAVRAWKLRGQNFDLLHHLIGGMDWMPSGLALCKGPLLWGPVGSENTHPRMRRHLPLCSRIIDSARVTVRSIMRTFDPFVRLTGMRASVVLSHTPETMPARFAPKLRPFTQTGIQNSPELARQKGRLDRSGPLKLVFAGELKDWKGARLALQAALQFFERDAEATLLVIGDGPLRAELEKTARSHPQSGRVTFAGRLPMPALLDALYAADVFLYPSFHHGLATVVLQAMLTGLPLVCIEGDAIARTIGGAAGIAVPLTADRDPVKDIAAALEELAQDEPRRLKLAAAARATALKDYDYDRLAERLHEVYLEVAATRATPDCSGSGRIPSSDPPQGRSPE
jgi:glycosyltransferase involved in cell wall biosynthesis